LKKFANFRKSVKRTFRDIKIDKNKPNPNRFHANGLHAKNQKICKFPIDNQK